MITIKDGVYMKSNGNLVHVYDDGEFIVIDENRIKTVKIGMLTIKNPMVLKSTSRLAGWGPTSFFKKAEYLGEL